MEGDNKARIALNIAPDIPVPAAEGEVNETQLQKYINLHPKKEFRELLGKLLKEVNYISFNDFTQTLSSQVSWINSNLTNGEFIIVNTNTEKGKSPKSDHWVTSIARKNLKAKPKSTLTISELTEYFSRNPGTNNVVIFDDCCYSGEQMRQMVAAIWREKPPQPLHIYFAVPYMTHNSEELIQENKPKGISVTLLKHRNIPTIGEIMGKLYQGSSFSNAAKILDLAWDTGERIRVPSLTLTYFQHKTPDHISFPETLRKGLIVDYDLGMDRRWFTGKVVDPPPIPSIIPPYQTNSSV